eukprot:1155084-Pelagomonas_calceolata.AAC.1
MRNMKDLGFGVMHISERVEGKTQISRPLVVAHTSWSLIMAHHSRLPPVWPPLVRKLSKDRLLAIIATMMVATIYIENKGCWSSIRAAFSSTFANNRTTLVEATCDVHLLYSNTEVLRYDA